MDPPTAMAHSKKFMFDVSFEVEQPPMASPAEDSDAGEAEANKIDDEPEATMFSEDEMDAARDEGFAAGREAAISDAANATELEIFDLLSNISSGFDKLFALQNTRNVEIFDASINAALAVTKKCFPHLTETHGVAEIDAMVREILSGLIGAPKVVISVRPDLQSSFEARFATIAQQSGFEGRISVLADPDLDGSDCRIDWTDGSAERNLDALWQRIDEIIEHNLALVTRSTPPTQDQTSKTDSEETDTAAVLPPANSAPAPEIEASTLRPAVMPETSAPAPKMSFDSPLETRVDATGDTSDGSVSLASGELPAEQINRDDLVENLASEMHNQTTDINAAPNPMKDNPLGAPLDVEPSLNDAILTDDAEDTKNDVVSVPLIDGESNG